MRRLKGAALPAFAEHVAFAASPHVGVAFVNLKPSVLLKQVIGGVLSNEILAEIAIANRAKPLQVAVRYVHLDVSTHAVRAHPPENRRVNNAAIAGDNGCLVLFWHVAALEARARKLPAAARRSHISE